MLFFTRLFGSNRKHNLQGSRLSGVRPRLESLEDRAVPAGFVDDFESPTLHPFWQTETSSGNIVYPSTERVHGGSQSVQLSTYMSSDHKGLNLLHWFDTPQYGTVSIWVYDTAAGAFSSNAFYLTIYNPDAGTGTWGAHDYDFRRPEDNYIMGTENYQNNTSDLVYTEFNRSIGWHQWTIEAVPNQLTYSFDGQALHTVEIDLPFTRILFGEGAPNWRPAWTVYYDDFEFVPANTVPAVNAGPDQPTTEGTALTWAGSFTDPDTDTWFATVDYGDGSGPQELPLNDDKSFTLDHLYADEGEYTVTVAVTDSEGAVGTDTVLVQVGNAAADILAFVTSSPECGGAIQGTPVGIAGAFFDPGVLDTHTATISWGDGSPVQEVIVEESDGVGFVIGQHVYAQGGIYTVTLAVTDNDGATSTQTALAVVSGVGVQNGVLRVIGTENADAVTVSKNGSGNYVVTTNFLTPTVRTINAAGLNRIEAYLCDGNDALVITTTITLPTMIEGGAGNDSLFGGSGNNILLGGEGNDSLTGGSARDLLIGGMGRDQLMGQGGDDLLIAGWTAHDTLPGSLLAIMDEWKRTDASYNDRISHLINGGGLNGPALLNAATVGDDGAKDTLFGGAGRDAFFLRRTGPAALTDLALDLLPNEFTFDTTTP